MIAVTLTPDQVAWASRIGADRLRTAKGEPRWGYRGGRRSGLDTHVLGAQAELAFCLALGVPWPARVGNYKGADVDPEWEVRWSTLDAVKVTPNDGDDRLVALVRGESPEFRVVGYIRAGGAKRHYPLADPGNRGWPAHFVPARRLAPIDPGFHTVHGWHLTRAGWVCAFCPETSVDAEQQKPPERG